MVEKEWGSPAPSAASGVAARSSTGRLSSFFWRRELLLLTVPSEAECPYVLVN